MKLLRPRPVRSSNLASPAAGLLCAHERRLLRFCADAAGVPLLRKPISVQDLIAGTLTPGSGEVRLDGVPLKRFGAGELPRRRVLIPQEAYVFDGTLGAGV